MRDMLKDGEQWLVGKQAASAAQVVVYSRASDSVSLPATIGRSQWEVPDTSGLLLRVESRDYVIETDLLLLNSSPIEPAVGDLITESGFVYEVSPPGPGLAHWSWAGDHRTAYRIHTKLVGPEES
jgi:hypothetical protein